MSTFNQHSPDYKTKINEIEKNKFKIKKDKRPLHNKIKIYLDEHFPRSINNKLTLNLSYTSFKKNNKMEIRKKFAREIHLEHEKISNLEKEKNAKLNKIEDLRKIIDRIAHEKMYDKSFQVTVKHLVSSLKKDSCNCSGSIYNSESNINGISDRLVYGSNKSCRDAEVDGIEIGFVKKEFQAGGGRLFGDYFNQGLSEKHLIDCLSYWRENLYPANYIA